MGGKVGGWGRGIAAAFCLPPCNDSMHNIIHNTLPPPPPPSSCRLNSTRPDKKKITSASRRRWLWRRRRRQGEQHRQMTQKKRKKESYLLSSSFFFSYNERRADRSCPVQLQLEGRRQGGVAGFVSDWGGDVVVMATAMPIFIPFFSPQKRTTPKKKEGPQKFNHLLSLFLPLLFCCPHPPNLQLKLCTHTHTAVGGWVDVGWR